MNKKALIFDFDLTLADASVGIFRCANYALTELGYPEHGYATIKKTIGLSLPETFTSLSGSSNKEERSEFVKLFVDKADIVMNDNTTIYPEALKVIPALHKTGYKLAIVSTKYRYRIGGALKKENLHPYFEFVIGGEDVKNPKPNPEGLISAVTRFNLQKLQAVYIGDSIIDAMTAKNAEVDFIGVLTGTSSLIDFKNGSCKYIIKNLLGLSGFLS